MRNDSLIVDLIFDTLTRMVYTLEAYKDIAYKLLKHNCTSYEVLPNHSCRRILALWVLINNKLLLIPQIMHKECTIYHHPGL